MLCWVQNYISTCFVGCREENKNRIGDVVTEQVNDLGRRGIRSLAVARNAETGGDFEFVGILSFLDPPRPDSRETIMRAHERGIDVKMITGDQVCACSLIGLAGT